VPASSAAGSDRFSALVRRQLERAANMVPMVPNGPLRDLDLFTATICAWQCGGRFTQVARNFD
jgi:hypothetical protein